MGEVMVRIFDFGLNTIYGATVLDRNGDYNVYLNARTTYEMQKSTLKHEMKHIADNDFHNRKTIKEIGD